MRARSWMAALALIGAASILIGRGFSAQANGRAQEPGRSDEAPAPREEPRAASPKLEPRPGASGEKSSGSGPQYPAVQLSLAIAGLGVQGCDVEVKPANPSCKFRPSPVRHVTSDGHATIELRDIELRGADKTCTMAITVREPGQPPQTVYRGFRLGSPKPGTIPNFTCLISSRLAEADSRTTRK